MRTIAVVVSLIVLIAGGYYLYRSPRVQELFVDPGERREDPLKFLEELPEINPPDPEEESRQSRPGSRTPVEPKVQTPATPPEKVEAQPPPPPSNQTPNSEVGRVLMQILAAKGLAQNVSIAVTDTEVLLTGTVASVQARDALISTVDKGRESRRLNADRLKVAP